jgi:hypothetical protein
VSLFYQILQEITKKGTAATITSGRKAHYKKTAALKRGQRSNMADHCNGGAFVDLAGAAG